jgi:murein L,D-transpeptidase YcbB/YkuD
MSVISSPSVSRRVVLVSAAALAACGRYGPAGASQAAGQQIADPLARRFYAARGWRTAWDPGAAKTLSQIVAGATAHGLDPAAFAPKRLAGLSDDEALTLAALAYAKALASGFVEPGKIERVFTLARNNVDVAAGLAGAMDRGDLEAWFGALAPPDPEYRTLSAAYLAALGQSGLPSAPAQGAPVGSSLAPADRLRQLAVNLERRRWLNRAPTAHRIDVNTAGAFLGYFKPGQPAWWTRAVVGRDDHATPSIEAAFHKLVANPPWRVPPDIAEKEILPKGAGYMAREDMHVVDGRVEQAPGPKSALGLVKFDVEDPYDIYLHDTPSKAMFAAPERHRSHGCVRVENAVAFARSLAGETGKAQAFDQALASSDTADVDLGQSIAVRMLYHTAYLDQRGQVLLAPDVYGVDGKLAAALGFGQAAAAARQTEPEILFGP